MKTYDAKSCLHIIELGAEDATDLLLGEIPNAERRFKALDKSLRAFLADIRKTFPDACYYTGSGGFNLMLGPSHDERGERGQQHLVALTGRAEISDGDF